MAKKHTGVSEAGKLKGMELRQLRKAEGWKQEELANMIGVSRETISRWENGYWPEIYFEIALTAILRKPLTHFEDILPPDLRSGHWETHLALIPSELPALELGGERDQVINLQMLLQSREDKPKDVVLVEGVIRILAVHKDSAQAMLRFEQLKADLWQIIYREKAQLDAFFQRLQPYSPKKSLLLDKEEEF